MFTVVDTLPSASKRNKQHVYLQTDRWDDWGKYRTMFTMFVVDSSGETHEAGSVKIGEVGLKPHGGSTELPSGYRAPTLRSEFPTLSSRHFSIGQSENYYETLNLLEYEFRIAILSGMHDCAYDLSTFDAHINEEVMSESLLRSVAASTVRTRYHRLAHGNARLTRFQFHFTLPDPNIDGVQAPTLRFDVVPDSQPPTNIHVLIGRNGVGKSRCVQSLSLAVLGVRDNRATPGTLEFFQDGLDDWTFAGLVLVSFSVFDQFDLPSVETSRVKATQVGLRYKPSGGSTVKVKTPKKLAEDFVASLAHCRTGPRAFRLQTALEALETDPLFDVADIGRLLRLDEDEWGDEAAKLFMLLSSGHAIVLLTMTRLVELVDERTLVILDEPEGHLHPPLLAAFIRAVGDLLVQRNGVCLIATHSPVVLQEVPRHCAWKLNRSGAVSTAERPSLETFGENVGVLTREVFGLEVTQSGFHGLLRKALEQNQNDYDETVADFGGHLGAEAKAILMGLAAANRRASED